MGILMNYPKFQAIDSNGAPLVGGLLYTYVAGSTTEKATYSDRSCATANTNPVVLDSRGEAVVYLSGAYKFVLKDSDGVEIWTLDNIEGASGSSSYTFYPSSSEVDHGLSGLGGSLYDIVTSIGTGKKATVRFLHSGAATTTEYTVTTSIDLSSYTNIRFEFEEGAVLAGSGNVTFYSPARILAEHLQQIFAGTGAITFSVAGTVSGWWFGQTTAGVQAMIDSVETVKGEIVFDGLTEFETTGIKFYPGQRLVWGPNTTFKMTAASGVVLRLAQSSTVTVPTAGPLDEPHLICPKINMDAKGDAGILIECAENAVVDHAKITNVPSGTFNYDDGDGSGAQAYDKSGIMVKGINGIYGCYYTSLIKPIVLGVSAASKGQTGILLTTTTGATAQLPNQTYIEKPESRMFVYGIRILQETASTTIINPEFSTNTTAVDDDGEGTFIISPQLENCTTGIDSVGASRAQYLGRGSTSGLTTAWLNTGTNADRNTWWRSTGLVIDTPDDGAGSLETYSHVKRIESLGSADTRALRLRVADATALPVDTVALQRNTVNPVTLSPGSPVAQYDIAQLNLDYREDTNKGVLLRLSRGGGNMGALETNYPAQIGFKWSALAFVGSSGAPDGWGICLKGSDNNYYWTKVTPTITKTDTGDPAYNFGDGTICVNTNDNTVRIYADSGWRTIASGW